MSAPHFWLCADVCQPADPGCHNRVDLDQSSDLHPPALLDWRKQEPAFLAEMLHGASLDEQTATLHDALPRVFDGGGGFCFFPLRNDPADSWYERIDSATSTWESGLPEALRSYGVLLVAAPDGKVSRHYIGMQPDGAVLRCKADGTACAGVYPSYRTVNECCEVTDG